MNRLTPDLAAKVTQAETPFRRVVVRLDDARARGRPPLRWAAGAAAAAATASGDGSASFGSSASTGPLPAAPSGMRSSNPPAPPNHVMGPSQPKRGRSPNVGGLLGLGRKRLRPKTVQEERMMLTYTLALSAEEARREIGAPDGGSDTGGSGAGPSSLSGHHAGSGAGQSGGSGGPLRGRGGASGAGRRLLAPDGSLLPVEIDHKLWGGAYEQGWRVRPKAVAHYLANKGWATGNYVYISPAGTRFTNRNAARESAEGMESKAAADANADSAAAVAAVAVAAESDDDDDEDDEGEDDEDDEEGGEEHDDVRNDVEDDEVMEAMDVDDAPAVLQLGRASLVEHASRSAEQIAAAAFAKHAESAQAALALAAQDGSEDEDEGERCMIWGCKRELLQCFGAKQEVGSAVGMADEAHVVCAPCLTRWWEAQNKLLASKGKSISARKKCPCCRCDIRSTVETRAEPDRFHSTGLMKIRNTWGDDD